MNETTASPRPGLTLKRAAAGLYEALPAILLAAALLAPAFAALAGDETPPRRDPQIGLAIADQGNRALIQIRAGLRMIAAPVLPKPATTIAEVGEKHRG
jgi:hypothetical protein